MHRAAAWGRPIVMSDLPDLRTVAEEEHLQVDYVPAGEPAALAEALLRVLRDPERQIAHARHNLAMMQAMTLEHTSTRYVAAFEHAQRRRENLTA
jgi:glycosyltransferase involved in cell wall biosynthesis